MSLIHPPYAPAARLASLADRYGSACHAPRLLALTDPARTPDPLALAERLPAGSGLIYRHFGAAKRYEIAGQLAQICRTRGLVFLVSSDLDLALHIQADGVHWPERFHAEAARARARACPLFFTGAAHSRLALARAEEIGLDAALLSPVFASNSPSATRPLGAMRTRLILQRAKLPVYLLGGMQAHTIKRIGNSGAAGFAMVEAVEKPEATDA